MVIKQRQPKKQYHRSGDMYDVIRDNGYKITNLPTKNVWIDPNGNPVYIDFTPIRWDIIAKRG